MKTILAIPYVLRFLPAAQAAASATVPPVGLRRSVTSYRPKQRVFLKTFKGMKRTLRDVGDVLALWKVMRIGTISSSTNHHRLGNHVWRQDMAKKQKARAPKKGKRAKVTAKSPRQVRATAKAARSRPKGPRSQALPGMEQVRNERLDGLCESIGDERERTNAAKTEEIGLKQSALQVMQRGDIHIYRHAGVELARVPGADKLRVRLRNEEGEAAVSGGETTEGDEPLAERVGNDG